MQRLSNAAKAPKPDGGEAGPPRPRPHPRHIAVFWVRGSAPRRAQGRQGVRTQGSSTRSQPGDWGGILEEGASGLRQRHGQNRATRNTSFAEGWPESRSSALGCGARETLSVSSSGVPPRASGTSPPLSPGDAQGQRGCLRPCSQPRLSTSCPGVRGLLGGQRGAGLASHPAFPRRPVRVCAWRGRRAVVAGTGSDGRTDGKLLHHPAV